MRNIIRFVDLQDNYTSHSRYYTTYDPRLAVELYHSDKPLSTFFDIGFFNDK